MAKPEPTRFYLRRSANGFARLFWIQNHRANEMLLGAYSLDGKPATITHEFPERLHSPGDPPTMDFHGSDATPVKLPVDHFTCHADGRFHAKTRRGKPLYVHVERGGKPLGPDSPVFLDLVIVSDVVSKYRSLSGSPKYPHVWIQVPADATVALNAIFSGARYPIVPEALATMASRGRTEGGVLIRSGTIHGVVWGSPRSIAPDAAANRPPGTLFIFQWRRVGRTVGAKAFVLN